MESNLSNKEICNADYTKTFVSDFAQFVPSAA